MSTITFYLAGKKIIFLPSHSLYGTIFEQLVTILHDVTIQYRDNELILKKIIYCSRNRLAVELRFPKTVLIPQGVWFFLFKLKQFPFQIIHFPLDHELMWEEGFVLISPKGKLRAYGSRKTKKRKLAEKILSTFGYPTNLEEAIVKASSGVYG